jgi:hypothetical protein
MTEILNSKNIVKIILTSKMRVDCDEGKMKKKKKKYKKNYQSSESVVAKKSQFIKSRKTEE